jgi:hypothetical protein
MRYDFTDNAIVFYKAGVDNGRFDPGDERQRYASTVNTNPILTFSSLILQ